MKVYALIGQSGTGKSYKAFIVARDRNIDYIIDDGLLIGGTRIVAGKSAKKEKTKMASVRRALFEDTVHRKEVREALVKEKPDKLLIIGTSIKMANQIRELLELPEFEGIIHITDVSTQKEIELARKSRTEDGKHVIPVPTFEIKKDFSGYFIDSLKIFNRKEKITDVFEKTIIRPTYSYLGKYEVSKTALNHLVIICVKKFERVNKVLKVKIESSNSGVIIDVEVALKLVTRIDQIVVEIQKELSEKVEYMTGMNVLAVNITVKSISGTL